MTRPFGATNKPHTCLWCGHALRPTYHETKRTWIEAGPTCHANASDSPHSYAPCQEVPRLVDGRSVCALGHINHVVHKSEVTGREIDGYGYGGADHFCTAGCAFEFATALARQGRRLAVVAT